MKKTVTLVLAAASMTLAGAAVAQDRPQRPDRGADITRADAETRATAAFARMDANSDGVLDTADREARARERFARMDADGNGQLSFEEMHSAREGRREAMQERRAEAGERRGRRGAQRMAMRGGGPRMMGQRLQQADTNGDNAISQAEFTAAALARFDSADANNDGTVTAEERRAQMQERRGQMRERRGANR